MCLRRDSLFLLMVFLLHYLLMLGLYCLLWSIFTMETPLHHQKHRVEPLCYISMDNYCVALMISMT